MNNLYASKTLYVSDIQFEVSTSPERSDSGYDSTVEVYSRTNTYPIKHLNEVSYSFDVSI